MAGPHGHARVSASNPEAAAICDRCGRLFSRSDLMWQYQWAGAQLINLRILVDQSCLDIPQEQLRSIVIPPDPIPVRDPRPQNFAVVDE